MYVMNVIEQVFVKGIKLANNTLLDIYEIRLRYNDHLTLFAFGIMSVKQTCLNCRKKNLTIRLRCNKKQFKVVILTDL